MKRLSQKNYEHNRRIPLPEGLLNGQSLGAVSGMRYGRSTVSYSGCEVIAVYNALHLCGSPVPFPDAAKYMERYRVLCGFWGTNFLFLGRSLKHFGLDTKRYRSKKRIASQLKAGKAALLVYWTKKRFCSSVHTVCVQMQQDGQLTVYNAYNRCGHPVQMPLGDMMKKRLIFAYVID